MSIQRMFVQEPKTSSRLHPCRGAPAVLSSGSRGSHTGFDRVIQEDRAQRILEKKYEYIYNESFDAPGAAAAILAPMPGGAYSATANGWLPASPHFGAASPTGATPVLDAEQEIHLFRKMNYLKFRASRLRESLDPAHTRESELDEIERLQEEALAVKHQIIRAYLRLVVSIARKQFCPARNLFELVSDGNLGLIHAVEKFDFGRGFRFSTYATKAITRRFVRSIPQEMRRHLRFVTGFEKMLNASADHRTDEDACESDPRWNWRVVEGLLGRLSDRERRVLVSRYGLDGADVLTLAELGAELGISRQRVLQIESKARENLRTLVHEVFRQPIRPEHGPCV